MNPDFRTSIIDETMDVEIGQRVHAVTGATLYLSSYALEINQAFLEKDSKHLMQVLAKYHTALEQAINQFDDLDLYCKEEVL